MVDGCIIHSLHLISSHRIIHSPEELVVVETARARLRSSVWVCCQQRTDDLGLGCVELTHWDVLLEGLELLLKKSNA